MGTRKSFPFPFPWDSHGNGSSFGLLMGMEIAYFIGENQTPTGSVNSLLFLHSNMQ